MVGRPAGGKTFVAQKLARYLNWLGVRTKGTREHAFVLACHHRHHPPPNTHNLSVFSVAERRRETIGFQPANYYNPANIDGIKVGPLQLARADPNSL